MSSALPRAVTGGSGGATTDAMKPLSQWPLEDRRRVTGVFTDIDDTLTTEGAITPDALQALHQLRAAGLHVIAITGRPVGWSEPFAKAWPVDAIVAENGAVALQVLSPSGGLDPSPSVRPEHSPPVRPELSPSVRPELVEGPVAQHTGLRQAQPERMETTLSPASEQMATTLSGEAERMDPLHSGEKLRRFYRQDAATRRTNYARMQSVGQRVLREVPGATLAQDSAGRETDMAIDHSEFTHLSAEGIAQVVRIMQSEGMNATVSSIHINGWYGDHNKWVGAEWMVRELLGRDLRQETERWAYVGDSTNDQLMFEAFDNSVGVANIARFAAQLTHAPRYVTLRERGAGFAEVAAALLAARGIKTA